MKTNNGFIMQNTQRIQEINGDATLYVHEKTGAQLLHIANDDVEKAFSVTFRTLPQNDTGVAHILEHSVLAGSQKYPVKEPFVELMKGSLNSFINAMTFPDRTGYPFASPNEKDFFNILDVYLDAVFNPTIYTTKETFMQEGWHYEIDEADKLIINGVVYSEMKGAMSSPNRMLFQYVQNSLFDNLYSYNSGGDPDAIPTLTQEEFEKFHSTYYHPSNSLMCVYGDIDINKVLAFINDNYLCKYEKQDKDYFIASQAPIGNREVVKYYGISDTDTEENKTFFAKSCIIEDVHNREMVLAIGILNSILLDTEASHLKQAMLKAGIAQNVRGMVETDILQPFLAVIADNANLADKDKFLQIYNDTLSDLVKNGIDKKLIEACVSKAEFELREGDSYGYPRGILYSITASTSWLFGDKPTDGLFYEKAIASIKEKMHKGYFENIIDKYMLNSNHSSLVVLTPKKGINQAAEAEFSAKMEKIKAGLSAKEIEKIKTDAAALLKRQQTPDTPEALASMPRLSISDVDKKPQTLSLCEKEIEGVKVVHNDLFTSGIGYTNLYFDISDLSVKELQYAQLLAFMFDKLGAGDLSFDQLSNEINICSGGISADCSSINNIKSKKTTPYFVVTTSAVAGKLADTYALVNKMINKMDLQNEERVTQLIQTAFAHSQMFLQNAGHVVALLRQRSYFSQDGLYGDSIKGLGYAVFIKQVCTSGDTKNTVAQLKAVYDKIFNKAKLLIYFAGVQKDFKLLQENIGILTQYVFDKASVSNKEKFVPCSANEGIASQSLVQYVCKGGSYTDEGYSYTGKLVVLKNMLHSGYLWNSLRVQGGAYGVMNIFDASGFIQIVSYRDPHLSRTIGVYDKIAEHLRTMPINQAELDMQIIAAVGEVDAPKLPKQKAIIGIMRYLSGIDNQELALRKEEILSTTIEDVRQLADLFELVMNKNSLCVYGSASKVNEAKDKFNKIITL